MTPHDDMNGSGYGGLWCALIAVGLLAVAVIVLAALVVKL